MKNIIVYSTISGNTKAVCERIFNVLPKEKDIVNVKEREKINFDDYDNIIIGFWCDKGSMDKDSKEFLNEIKNKNVYFVGTLGAKPNSKHWQDVYQAASELCKKENNFIDGLLIWGRISKELQERILKLPADHFHGPTPERIQRWKEASTHPDENDFKTAENFFKNLFD